MPYEGEEELNNNITPINRHLLCLNYFVANSHWFLALWCNEICLEF